MVPPHKVLSVEDGKIPIRRLMSRFKTYIPLLLGHWYEIMALYYVKAILTEISASRQDRKKGPAKKGKSSESNF